MKREGESEGAAPAFPVPSLADEALTQAHCAYDTAGDVDTVSGSEPALWRLTRRWVLRLGVRKGRGADGAEVVQARTVGPLALLFAGLKRLPSILLPSC